MRLLRDRRSRSLAILIAIGLIAGVSGGTLAAFSATTANSGNSFGTKADYEPPTVSRSIIARTTSVVGGKMKQGSAFYVYAQVTDGGNPAAGVGIVTADVCNVKASPCNAVTMVSGSYTVNGLSYNYRSASVTALAVLTEGAKTYTIAAADSSSPVNSGTTNFSVTIDNTAPTAVDIQTADVAGTPGKPEAGDTVTYTFSEQMETSSILAGWDGSSTLVRGRIDKNGCAVGSDAFVVQTTAGVAIPMGTVCLGGSYANNRNFTNSTIEQFGSVILVTLGTPSAATSTEGTPAAMTWTPDATALDVAGNACSTSVATESTPPNDVEF